MEITLRRGRVSGLKREVFSCIFPPVPSALWKMRLGVSTFMVAQMQKQQGEEARELIEHVFQWPADKVLIPRYEENSRG